MPSLLRWWCAVSGVLLAAGCVGDPPSEISCEIEEHLFDGRRRFSCAELYDLHEDAYDSEKASCESLPGQNAIFATHFDDGLCRRSGIVGGCGDTRGTVWYYPNAEGYPSAEEVPDLCTLKDLPYVPAPGSQ